MKIPKIISKKIKEKYGVLFDMNTFVFAVKDNIKDRIDAEIGDIMQSEVFHPQVKHKRWDNEVNLSYRYLPEDDEKPQIKTRENQIIWSTSKVDVSFYDHEKCEEHPEKAYEIDVVLKEKPKSNIIKFSLNTKDVQFLYQPPMTERVRVGDRDIFSGKDIIEVTEERVIVEGGIVSQEIVKPEYVGCYVVYAKKEKINIVGGKEYRTGQVGIIERPRIADSTGKWCWGKLKIDEDVLDENGFAFMAIEIPKDFFEEAVFPVIVDPNFGYTTTGTGAGTLNNYIVGFDGAAASGGTLASISFYVKAGGTGRKAKGAVYSNGTATTLYSNSTGAEIDVSTSAEWHTSDVTSGMTISAGTTYKPVAWGGSGTITMYYNAGGTGYYYSYAYAATFPSSASFGSGSTSYCVYGTYTLPPTPTVDGVTDPADCLGVADFMWINGVGS